LEGYFYIGLFHGYPHRQFGFGEASIFMVVCVVTDGKEKWQFSYGGVIKTD
jgi:hypothetical protein